MPALRHAAVFEPRLRVLRKFMYKCPLRVSSVLHARARATIWDCRYTAAMQGRSRRFLTLDVVAALYLVL